MSDSGDIASESYTLDLAAPANLDAAERAMVNFPAHYDGPPVALQHFDHVWLGKRSQIVDATGILPQSYPPGETPDRRDAVRLARAVERLRSDAELLAGERLLASDWYSDNYYHWMADTLARLEALARMRREGELLLPARVFDRTYVRESLEAWPQFTVRRYDPEERAVQVEHLIVPSHAAHNGFHHPVLTLRAFERVSRHFGAVRQQAGRRIHVTRRNARVRRLVNEAETVAMLEARGFETVDFEGMALGEQARLMGEAEIVAGPHGAGLTNMGFMAKGGAVVELRHLAGPSNCYISLANVCGLTHYLVPGEPLESAAHLHVADIAVAPERLARTLDQVEAALAANKKGPSA